MAVDTADPPHRLYSQLAFDLTSCPQTSLLPSLRYHRQTITREPRVGIIQHWGLYAKGVGFFCCIMMNVLSLHDIGFVPGMLLFL